MKGFELKEVPDLWLTTDADSLLQKLGPSDIVMIDGAVDSQLNVLLRQNLNLEWSSDRDVGQYIYRKK